MRIRVEPGLHELPSVLNTGTVLPSHLDQLDGLGAEPPHAAVHDHNLLLHE
ncbi:hypothetical protein QJS04_geneDACA020450 [Acorus gramineus]|uniref:Uncharacterized protein n=1 Tax=Acorus gramineus TaxID=55184 RepID=A0AAV9AEP6_ACOGR|nr:hypothetical protein QJS04_geneDACA000976 [Acorus gramineus]KAK1262685.1 hypothetical protein QJS04_geneDACA020450 [Acorus gramineus]